MHATAARLEGPWRADGTALEADATAGEAFTWSPHVVLDRGTYHMFYVGNGQVWSGFRPC